MGSILSVTDIESLQKKVVDSVKRLNGMPGMYVCLNKAQKSIESLLKKEKVNVHKIFFVDCVASEKEKEEVLHIAPYSLEFLEAAVATFIKDIKGEKFIILDALATLLIYNDTNRVAEFVQNIMRIGEENEAEIIAFSPATKGADLLEKISCFFDKVYK